MKDQIKEPSAGSFESTDARLAQLVEAANEYNPELQLNQECVSAAIQDLIQAAISCTKDRPPGTEWRECFFAALLPIVIKFVRCQFSGGSLQAQAKIGSCLVDFGMKCFRNEQFMKDMGALIRCSFGGGDDGGGGGGNGSNGDWVDPGECDCGCHPPGPVDPPPGPGGAKNRPVTRC